MGSETMAAVIGGICGALAGGLVSYLIWLLQQPRQRKESLIQEKMKQRWDSATSLLRLVTELNHGLQNIRTGRTRPYVELGETYRKQLREEARKNIPLLGDQVAGLVHELTGLYEKLYMEIESDRQPDDQLYNAITVQEGRTREAIELELRSPVRS
jgi:hypothetical protein